MTAQRKGGLGMPSTRARARFKWNSLRKEALEALGGKCTWCGFDDWRALQIDHIDGRKGQKRLNGAGQRVLLHEIIDGFVHGLQLLCANCNWIKRYEEDETRIV